MDMKDSHCCLALSVALMLCVPVAAQAPADVQAAFKQFNSRQYAAAATSFESVIRRQPTARNCYYAALANQSANKPLRARQLFQYITTSFPSSAEAAYAQKALKQLPLAASNQASNNDLPDSVKNLIPADMRKLLDTPMGKQALQQVMSQKKDEIDTIRKAEKAGVMKQDKLAEAAESVGLMTSHAQQSEMLRPFTAADIAKRGAKAIDQMIYPNCWFEASMAAMAELPKGQQLLADMIHGKGKDTYVVRFPGDGVEYTVTAADLVKANIHDSALWASLIEYAQTLKFPNNKGADDDADLSRLDVGLSAISGKKAQTIWLGRFGNVSDQELSAFIGGAVTSKNPIVAGTLPGFGSEPAIVVPTHAYTVTGYDPASNMITLRNPHGNNSRCFELAGDPKHLDFEQLDDGVFKISLRKFQKYFSQIARSFI
jgi:hypothetical protein